MSISGDGARQELLGGRGRQRLVVRAREAAAELGAGVTAGRQPVAICFAFCAGCLPGPGVVDIVLLSR